MKIALAIAVALVILSSIPMHSQQAGVSAQQSASARVGSRSVNESSAANVHTNRNGVSGSAYAAGDARMSPVRGELENKLDAKHARVGQQVIVKTTQKARMADGTVLPKGTRLIGHVTRVQPRESGRSGSSMAIDFDRAEFRSGQSMAIHSMIESVSPAANLAASAADEDDAMMAPAMGGGGMMRTSAARGGGLLGGATGAVGGTVRGAGSTVGAAGSGLVSTTDSVGRDAVGATGRAAGDLGATAGNGLRGAAGGTGALAAHATGIPGVMLAGDASGATSGTLSASRRNLHLDGGTQMVLGVSAVR